MGMTLQVIVNGIQIGSVYVLFALGLTLIFGVMKVVNFAHGGLFSLAAYATLVVLRNSRGAFPGVPLWASYVLAFVVAVLFLAIVGVFLYWAFFRRFTGDLVSTLIVTIGFAMALEVVLRSVFTGNARSVPEAIPGISRFFGATISNERLAILFFAIVVTLALAGFLRYTRIGMALRAVTEDPEAAELQGISARAMAIWGVLLATTLAAFAGVLIAPATVLTPTMGFDFLMKGFVIIVLGGLGSVVGAILAGFLVGLVESIGTMLFDLTTANILTFAAVILVLLFRPQGLLGHDQIR